MSRTGALREPPILRGRSHSGATVMDGKPPVDQLWRMIRSEAESAWRAIRSSVPRCHRRSWIIPTSRTHWRTRSARGSAGRADDRERLARVAGEAFSASPDLIEAASRDLQSIALHDPAMTTLLPPLLNFKGYVALQAWRVSNWLWGQPQRSRADAAKPVVRPAFRQHSSHRIDRHTGLSRSCHRHHHRCICRGRRRGDDPAERHHRPQVFGAEPSPKSAKAFISAPVRVSSATSASAISPRSVPVRSSSMTYPPAAPRSACRRG